jgi:hypothetical protein
LIKQETEENYSPVYENIKLIFHGGKKPNMVMLDGQNNTDNLEEEKEDQFSLTVPRTFKEILLT